MLILLHGENQYESLKALNDLSDQDSIIIDGEEIKSIDEIKDVSDSLSLFSQSRKTIIKRFSKNSKRITLQKDIIKWLSKNDPDLIFWEDDKIHIKNIKPVKKPSTLVSLIATKGEIKEFKLKDKTGIINIIKDKLNSSNIKTTPLILDLLTFRLGNDELIISSEIEKLILYLRSLGKDTISEKDIDIVTLYEPDHKIWDLSDAIGKKDKRTALRLINELVKTPTDFPLIIGVTIKQFFEMLLIRRFPSQRDRVIKASSMLPFMYYKNSNTAMNFSLKQLEVMYNKLIKLDYSVKSGTIDFKLGFTLLISTL